MKKSFIMFSSLLILLGFAQAAGAVMAPSVYFDFNGDTFADLTYGVTAGDSFSADIYAADLPDWDFGLAAFALTVSFDQTLATANSASLDALWTPGSASASPGAVFLEGSDPAGLPSTPPVPLGSIHFTSTGAGTFTLQMGLPYGEFSFVSGDSFPLVSEADLRNAQVTAAPVPLPGALWLFGSGLLGLLGLRRNSGKIS